MPISETTPNLGQETQEKIADTCLQLNNDYLVKFRSPESVKPEALFSKGYNHESFIAFTTLRSNAEGQSVPLLALQKNAYEKNALQISQMDLVNTATAYFRLVTVQELATIVGKKGENEYSTDTFLRCNPHDQTLILPSELDDESIIHASFQYNLFMELFNYASAHLPTESSPPLLHHYRTNILNRLAENHNNTPEPDTLADQLFAKFKKTQ